MTNINIVQEEDKISVTFRVDKEGFREIEKLHGILLHKNIATTIYNAVTILNRLYEYQHAGYKLTLEKDGTILSFNLPNVKL